MIKPMLAESGSPFDNDNFIFEIKWDGSRSLAVIKDGEVALYNRNGVKTNDRFPELMNLSKFIKAKDTILDGEVVVFREGVPSFQDLAKREHLQNSAEIKIRSAKYPVVFIVFDVIAYNGETLVDKTLMERKEILEKIVVESNILAISKYVVGKGKKFFAEVTGKGLEGIMAKKKDSKYFFNYRSPNWIKMKKIDTVEAVICGITKGTGDREDRFGAVVLGQYDEKGNLVYIGRAGSGFHNKELTKMHEMLKEKIVAKCPFPKNPNCDKPILAWVNPEFVCEVSFMEWSDDKKLRFPRWIRLRTDKKARECVV